MKWLILFFLILPITAKAEDAYLRPEGKVVTINGESMIAFSKDEFATWAKIYIDYRKLFDQKVLTDKYELVLKQTNDLYVLNMDSCNTRFTTMKNSADYWKARTDEETAAKFKALKSAKLESTLYQIVIGVESAAIVAITLGFIFGT